MRLLSVRSSALHKKAFAHSRKFSLSQTTRSRPLVIRECLGRKSANVLNTGSISFIHLVLQSSLSEYQFPST
ncbi:unnamed protein product [Chondrus crispus]|uniref:Uncharacterized protein n=1 Tax=Chondrus crispus TaxID=2769 RepID=R7QDD9_CHOCR|nr:unnamed protein product [Chondrus crispus]CDF36507.1 unnamed protein product [Chondrus crispus]|eukprot:XP_005716326.1 unnamed protein product [Chondrus crispus]